MRGAPGLHYGTHLLIDGIVSVANPISPNLAKGTIGELLVQIRLLQFGVQAAPPLRDSGNDLIALRGDAIRTVQVKTTSGRLRVPHTLPTKFHLVALVILSGNDDHLLLDSSSVYLVGREELNELPVTSGEAMRRFEISQVRVDELFRDD
jgi:hypothetical protein